MKLLLFTSLLTLHALAVTTTFNNGSGNLQWQDEGNWNNGLPSADDIAVIGSQYSVELDSGTVTVQELQCSGDLDINSSAKLYVTKTGFISGSFSIDGSGSKFTYEGTDTFEIIGSASYCNDDAYLYSIGGGTLKANSIKTVTEGCRFYADNSSTLTLNGITSFEGSTSSRLDAQDGSIIQMNKLTGISNGKLYIYASGADGNSNKSKIYLNSLVSMTDGGTIKSESGSVILTPALVNLENVSLHLLTGGNVKHYNQFQEMEGCIVYFTRGTYEFTALTNADRTSLYLERKVTVTAPSLTKFNAEGSVTWEASGTDSMLKLNKITSYSGGPGSHKHTLRAESGGLISLLGIKTVSTGSIKAIAKGANSKVNLKNVQDLRDGGYLEVSNGGTLDVSSLEDLEDTTLIFSSGKSTLKIDQLQTCVRCSFQSSGGNWVFDNSLSPSLVDIDGSDIIASSGADISFPIITQYNCNSGSCKFEADGTGSNVDLSSFTTVVGAGGSYWLYMTALDGGKVKVPSVVVSSGGRYNVKADGTGSLVDIRGLKSMQDGGRLEAVNGGRIRHAIRKAYDVDIILHDDDSTMSLTTFTDLQDGGQVTCNGGVFSFPKVKDLNNQSLLAQSGCKLSFPLITSVNTSSGGITWKADGTGSKIQMNQVTDFIGAGGAYRAHMTAEDGGVVQLQGLTKVNQGYFKFTCDGHDSLVDVRNMSQLLGGSGSIEAENGCELRMNRLRKMDGVVVYLNNDGSTSVPVRKIKSNINGKWIIKGGNYSFDNLADDFYHQSVEATTQAVVKFPGILKLNEPYDIESDGDFTKVDFPNCTRMIGRSNYTDILATSGGLIDLSSVTSVKAVTNASYDVIAEGDDSVIKVGVSGAKDGWKVQEKSGGDVRGLGA